MGGRVYDPLAGRFTTADPIMQAPFALTQGQNRYAYVFNYPINLTDPSGFSTADAGTQGNVVAGLGPAEIGAAIVGGAYIATHGFSASLPGIGNIATTFLMNIGGGSTGGTFTAPAPTASDGAKNRSGSGPQTAHAVPRTRFGTPIGAVEGAHKAPPLLLADLAMSQRQAEVVAPRGLCSRVSGSTLDPCVGCSSRP